MVKVTGGGRGMKAIAAHFRYISKNGRLDIEDEARPGQPREAFNIMLSMPRGTDPLAVQHAASEFAKIELADHKIFAPRRPCVRTWRSGRRGTGVVVGSEAGSCVDSWAKRRRVSTLGAAGRRRGDDFGARSVARLRADFGRMINADARSRR